MGIDYYSCKYCGDSFPDVIDYVICDCGEHWCSDECAEADGYKRENCKLGYDTYNNECEDSCYFCKNRIEPSCKYCRREDFDDKILLDYALQKLGLSREGLIKQYKMA